MSDYLRLLTAITVAKCEREGLPIPKHDLTDAEREEGHSALDDAETVVMRQDYLDERDSYRQQEAADEERREGHRVPPWER